MLPSVASIALRSLRTGAYVRQTNYLKFNSSFENIMAKRDHSRGLTVTYDENYTIYSCVLATLGLPGHIAEVGVYKGNTAQLICEIKEHKELFLFDTFSGMPNKIISKSDNWELDTHRDTSINSVAEYLAGYPNVHFVPGIFPTSMSNYKSANFDNMAFSFVNIDVDLYQSTLDCLKYFYPRLVTGGRLVSHNYNLKANPGGDTPGVKKAFLEYFSESPDIIVEIAETQCLVIKQ